MDGKRSVDMKPSMTHMALVPMVMIYMALFLWTGAEAQDGQNPSVQNEDAADPALLRRAAKSLNHLKRALQRDHYPSALAALNIWRCDAMAADAFDDVQFRAYRRQIYEKSVDNILKWFDVCLEEKWIREADYCQKVYRLHARIINIFDQERYDEMTEKIERRKKEIEAEKKKR